MNYIYFIEVTIGTENLCYTKNTTHLPTAEEHLLTRIPKLVHSFCWVFFSLYSISMYAYYTFVTIYV